MKPDDLLDAIGTVDDIYIKKAKSKKNIRKTIYITLSSVAACMVLTATLWMTPEFSKRDESASNDTLNHILSDDSVEPGEDSAKLPEDDAQYEENESSFEVAIIPYDVWIYYVDGNEIKRELAKKINGSISERFALWKEKNGIGDDVILVEGYIEDIDAKTVYTETMVSYYPGYNFVLNLVVSSNLQDYFEQMDSEKLLESLEKTMLLGAEDDLASQCKEYNLTFK